MKTILFPALASLLCVVPAAAQQQPAQVEAQLIYEGGEIERAWIVSATNTRIRYKETEQSVATRDAAITDYHSIYFIEPPACQEAVELYQAGKYEEARAKFAALKTTYKALDTLPDNPSTNAAFHELECLRNLNQLDALVKGLEGFNGGALIRENERRQVELYAMWSAAQSQSWDRLLLICRERIEQRLPGYQRAQVAYCLGLGLEAKNEIRPAIEAYSLALTADAGTSTALARLAAVNALRLYKKDPGIQTAIKLWGTNDEDATSRGHRFLVEAGALAAIYDLTFGAGHPLPDDVKDMLKYRPVAAKAP